MLKDPDLERGLAPAARAGVKALKGRVRLLGRREEPSIEVWIQGQLPPGQVVTQVERARPHLEALASNPWRRGGK